jgi:hypothetical protein
MSVTVYLKSEPEAVKCSTEKGRTVDEKFGSFDGVSPLKFAKKQRRSLGCSWLKQPHVEKFV